MELLPDEPSNPGESIEWNPITATHALDAAQHLNRSPSFRVDTIKFPERPILIVVDDEVQFARSIFTK